MDKLNIYQIKKVLIVCIIVSFHFHMFAISHISCPGIVSLFSGNGLWSTLRILMIASSSPTPPTSIFPTSEAQYAFFCDPLSPFFSSLQSSSPRSSSHSLVDYSQLFRTLRSNGPQILFAILLLYPNFGRPAIFFPTLLFPADF